MNHWLVVPVVLPAFAGPLIVLGMRRDLLLKRVFGTAATAVGVGGVALVAAFPVVPLAFAWVAWVVGGFGMGLVIASTGLATMSMSAPGGQGRNAAALQSGESLGNSVITGGAGAVFAALHTGTRPSLTFGVALAVLAVVAVWATVNALRIGPVETVGGDA